MLLPQSFLSSSLLFNIILCEQHEICAHRNTLLCCVAIWMESIHNLPKLHEMCKRKAKKRSAWNARKQIVTWYVARDRKRIEAHPILVCPTNLTGSLNENTKYFIITSIVIHIYCLSFSFFFGVVSVFSTCSILGCLSMCRCCLMLLFRSFTMFFGDNVTHTQFIQA